MPAGRPTKYDKSMCEDIIPLMSEGASKCEVAAKIGISEDTLYRWQREIPEFSEAIKKGEQLSKAWWEEQGRINLKDKDFSPTLWYMNMKNRHGWRDKQEITGEDGGPIQFQKVAIELVDSKSKDSE